MKSKDIMDKINNRKFYLNRLEANKIDKNPEHKTVEITQETEYEVLENSDDKLSLKFITKTFIEPEALFLIKTEHIIEFSLKNSISKDEIEENINVLMGSIGNEVSYIIAFVTKEMVNTRMILPPALSVKETKKE